MKEKRKKILKAVIAFTVALTLFLSGMAVSANIDKDENPPMPLTSNCWTEVVYGGTGHWEQFPTNWQYMMQYSGDWHAIANPYETELAFDTGLFTPTLDLSGFSSVTLTYDVTYYNDGGSDGFGKVNVYSGGMDPANLEETLVTYTEYFDPEETFILDTTTYAVPSEVYIEFYQYALAGAYKAFCLDTVTIAEIGFSEGFEGDTFPPCPPTPTVVSIDPPTQNVSKGETFTVDVFVEPAEPIIAVTVNLLSFDPTLIQANSVTEGDLFAGLDTFFLPGTIDNINGTITLISVVTIPATGVSDPGTFCIIEFTALDQFGTSILDLEGVEASDELGNPVSVAVNDGEVVIPMQQYTLTIDVVGIGTTDPIPGIHTFDAGTVVPVTAIETDPEWVFKEWTGDIPSGQPPWTEVLYSGTGHWECFTEPPLVNPPEYYLTPNFAAADSDFFDSDLFDVGLFTPSLDLSGLSSVTLEFDTIFLKYVTDYAEVNVHSGGIFAEQLVNYTDWVHPATHETFVFDPSGYIDPSDVCIEFYYTNNGEIWQFWFSIDNVSISEIGFYEDFEGDTFPPGGDYIIMDGDKSITAVFTGPGWDVLLNFEENILFNTDTVIFGEDAEASDGIDDIDLVKPDAPPAPFIHTFLATSLPDPYDMLWEEYRFYDDTNDLQIFDLIVETDTAGGQPTSEVTITWDTSEVDECQYDFVGLFDGLSEELLVDMKGTGPGTFVFTADSGMANHFLIICSDNHAPVANNDFFMTFEGHELNIAAPGVLGNDEDQDEDMLTAILETDVSNGLLTLNADGSFDYMPDLGFIGTDSFTYKAFDGELLSNIATAEIEVLELNHISLQDGWNLISMPVGEPIDKTDILVRYLDIDYTWADAILAGIILDPTFGWAGGMYTNEVILVPGEGYWLWSYQDCELLIPSNAEADNHITNLNLGWNLVGIPYSTLLTKAEVNVYFNGELFTWAEAVGLDIILEHVYDWDRTNQVYILTDTFVPGFGYWVYAFHGCALKRA